jgi:serine/threonine protein kinase
LKDPDRASTIKAEIQVLKRVEPHPNLLNCIKMEMSSENNFYLIMEYCNGGTL